MRSCMQSVVLPLQRLKTVLNCSSQMLQSSLDLGTTYCALTPPDCSGHNKPLLRLGRGDDISSQLLVDDLSQDVNTRVHIVISDGQRGHKPNTVALPSSDHNQPRIASSLHHRACCLQQQQEFPHQAMRRRWLHSTARHAERYSGRSQGEPETVQASNKTAHGKIQRLRQPHTAVLDPSGRPAATGSCGLAVIPTSKDNLPCPAGQR